MSENALGGASSDSSASDKEVSCPSCSKSFSSEYGVKQHHAKSHGESLVHTTVECSYCGDNIQRREREVSDSGRNFCDQDCMGSWRSENRTGEDNPGWKDNTIELECKWCGSTYECWKGGESRSSFCSKDCLYQWRSEEQTGEDHPLYKQVTVECSNCSESMKRYPYEVEQSENLFCDRDCLGEWRSDAIVGEAHPNWVENTTTFVCGQCGEEYENTVRQEGRTRFCSQDCLTDWQSDNLSGEDSVHWNGGGRYDYGPNYRRQRQKARIRDRCKCQVCGKDERELGHIPQAHHIIKLAYYRDNLDAPEWYERGNRLDNLIMLCEDHHKEWEGIPLRPQID